MEKAVLLVFLLLLALVFLYSLSGLHLLINYLRRREPAEKSRKDCFTHEELPFITVQLPLYNEKNVVERLLRNIALLRYPKDKLEIQVLDDSTDDSVEITSGIIEALQQEGLAIVHLRRTNRKDFKAGALKEGLKSAKGEFIAIFDADFLPDPAWLLRTVPHFKDRRIGVVQTRWGHLNRNYSLLTKIQAFALDFHFILEQTGRNLGQHFINFNGTAGIWRKTCILDAGNWQGDTLTEDLDLSYRAQLKKWKFKYLEQVETPAELPITLAAARSQQFRWNKGAAENFQKNFLHLLKDKSLSVGTKIHGFFHLLNSSMFLVILLMAALSIPVLFIIDSGKYDSFLPVMGIFGISTVIFFFCYFTAWRRIHGGGLASFLSFIGMFFSFFSIAMGFSVHNSLAILEGHLGKKSDFIRTPKFNIAETGKATLASNPVPVKISFQLLLEILLLAYFIFGIYSAFLINNFSMFIFHLMLVTGFGYVVFNSLRTGNLVSVRKGLDRGQVHPGLKIRSNDSIH